MKKAQSLPISFITILIIFIVATQLFLAEYERITPENENFEVVEQDTKRIADLLSSHASPRGWDNSNEIKRIGLLKNGVITNSTMSEISKISYSKLKLMLATTNDFMFVLLNGTKPIKIGGSEFWGWNGLPSGPNGGGNFTQTFSSIESRTLNMAKAENFVKLRKDNSTVSARLVVYAWK
ncbi:hypothetical protein GF323_00545 [Candidatus Woesearchaeota archaeon]|nr:hypothetical protein [Candidatus Woesearchaeota archaeon]